MSIENLNLSKSMNFMKKALQKDYKQKNNLKEQIFISIQTDIGTFMSIFSNRIT